MLTFRYGKSMIVSKKECPYCGNESVSCICLAIPIDRNWLPTPYILKNSYKSPVIKHWNYHLEKQDKKDASKVGKPIHIQYFNIKNLPHL